MILDKDLSICGIVAEYNPLHKGHEYHIKKAKELTGASYVVVVMSGDFTQRGEPAICNKYLRAKMALLAGADMVIELPVSYALSSATDFAFGAISIFNSLNCIDYLCFGSESGDIKSIYNAASLLLNEDEAISLSIKNNLKNGMSYPKAKQLAYESTAQDISTFIGPNNILGIEYVKALINTNSNIKPVTIKRNDNGYNESSIDTNKCFSSARSIRNSLCNDSNDYLNFIPEFVNELLPNKYINTNDFSDLLYYKLLSEKDMGFTSYLDVSEELSNKIVKNLPNYIDFTSYIEILKSKNLTYARISRALFHILLNIKKDQLSNITYARILGLKKDASILTGTLKKHSLIPLISKLADANICPMLNNDINSANIYEHISSSNINELSCSPVIL